VPYRPFSLDALKIPNLKHQIPNGSTGSPP
jgi:hypothetical protein